MYCVYINVFDKLIEPTIGPKELLIWHCTVLFGGSDAVNYDYIVTNSINFLLFDSKCIPNSADT